jgi:hypothetical protein
LVAGGGGDRGHRGSPCGAACEVPGEPPWVVPAVLLSLLAALIIGDPGRIDRQKTWLRIVTSAVIALITVANLFAAARLVGYIITNNKLFPTTRPGYRLPAG